MTIVQSYKTLDSMHAAVNVQQWTMHMLEIIFSATKPAINVSIPPNFILKDPWAAVLVINRHSSSLLTNGNNMTKMKVLASYPVSIFTARLYREL